MDEQNTSTALPILRLHGRCYCLIPPLWANGAWHSIRFETLEGYQQFFAQFAANIYSREQLRLTVCAHGGWIASEPGAWLAQAVFEGKLQLVEVVPTAAPRGDTKAEVKKTALSILSTTVDVLPVVGSAKSALQVLLGFDPFTGESVQRSVEAVGIIAGLIPGGKAMMKVGRAGKTVKTVEWTLGPFKSKAKWAGQLKKRGWTTDQITEAINKGERFPAENLVNKGNPATRYVHPETGQSVVVDSVTKEVIHVGGSGFKY